MQSHSVPLMFSYIPVIKCKYTCLQHNTGWSFDNDRETDDVKMVEIIGRGGFGSVYKALWRGEICAVKVSQKYKL